MSAPSDLSPRLWHLPRTGRHAHATTRRVLIGRQGIFTASNEVVAHELLFRAPGRMGLRVDLWNSRQQDRATEHVLAAAFHRGEDVTDSLPSFVNFTRSYLLEHNPLPCDPAHVVIEVVESAYADEALRARLGLLRDQGFRIAIDDFIGTRSQIELLEHADYVKIDYRDLVARGNALAEQARSRGVTLIAERLEHRSALAECRELGFDLFQGHLFEPAIVVDLGHHDDEHEPALA